MATENNTGSGFDAGSEFAPMSEALAALTSGGAAPEAAPPAEQPAPATDGEDSSAAPSWADDQQDQGGDAPKAPSPVAPALEVKGAKGVKKFELDPNNAELKKTLEYGLGFRPMQAERDKAVQEAKALKTQVAPLQEKAAVWDELQSLAQAGHTDRVVRAVLGDQAYAAYRKSVADEENGYASADPAERARIDAERRSRDSEFAATQYDKKVKDLEAKMQAQEDRIEADRLRGIGQQALGKFSFRSVVADPDQAEALDNRLWKSAWAEIETLSEQGHDVTPQLVSRVFAQEAKVLRGGAAAAAQTRTQQVIDNSKQAAKQQAQATATARYPSTQPTAKAEGWNGRSMTDLLRRLRSNG